jgi:hypothetical protein
MNDKLNKEFVEAIRQGSLEAVVRALEAGADLECADQYGYPGLALRTASFMGKKEIVLELLRRGANANAANSDGPGAPLRMATRGKREEIMAILQQYTTGSLVEVPAKVPAAAPSKLPVEVKLSPSPAATPVASQAVQTELQDIESLVITACYGVDTNVLEGDLFRLSQSDVGVGDDASDEKKSTADESKPGKRKFW